MIILDGSQNHSDYKAFRVTMKMFHAPPSKNENLDVVQLVTRTRHIEKTAQRKIFCDDYDVISFSEFEARWRHGSVSKMSRKRTDTILSRIRADTGFSSSATNRNRNVSFAPHVTLGKLTEEPTPRFVVTLF